jgi:subtilase family serine protease
MLRFIRTCLPIVVLSGWAFAQAPASGLHSRPLVSGRIDPARLHALAGNTHPEATAANDRGRVPDSLSMDHLLMQLNRPPEQEQALAQLIQQMHTPGSSNYHHWLSAAQIGVAYGPAQQDIETVTAWLRAQGFTINQVSPSGMVVDFSGTAGQVRAALHTEIHYLSARGQQHVGNMSDPQIPAALAPAVAGIVSLHDFKPHAMRKRASFTFASGGYTNQAVTPADLATIYNFSPLFAAGITGKGQTIAVIEDSDLYDTADWSTFRTTFGLAQYTSGTLTMVHPGCIDPGVARGVAAGDDGEATLDAEWASAAAPDAAVQVASCLSTRATFGGFTALENLINSANPPSILSISYGNCEAENGEGSNLAFNAAFQQAVAEGISVYVAAGDEGGAGCDAGASAATHGIGVSGWASTPYNVAVGGTDFSDSYSNSTGTYWNSANSASYGSALSYIPEIPWNDSCAGGLLSSSFGFSTPYGAAGFCGSQTARQDGLLTVVAGSGGPSGCATGAPDISGVVSGTCQGYAKPAWQAALAGVPNDGVRDIPDVSLFAGDGIWGHYYIDCWSDVNNGGAPCTGDPSTWDGAGGTSFAAPIMAGLQALVNQSAGGAQGNPNYALYQLAAQQFGSGGAGCNASSGNAVAGNCIFYNVTQGDIDVNCGGSQNCFGAQAGGGRGFGRFGGGSNGALSTSLDSFAPAFGAAAGWNFATGIGSVNAYNLVTNWPAGASPANQ